MFLFYVLLGMKYSVHGSKILLEINLLENIICEMCDVSTHQLWVVVVYWCHVAWLSHLQPKYPAKTWAIPRDTSNVT